MSSSAPSWQVRSVCLENCSLLEMKGRAGRSVLQTGATHLVNSSLYGIFFETFVRILFTIPPTAVNTGLPRSSKIIRQFWLMRLFMASPARTKVGDTAVSEKLVSPAVWTGIPSKNSCLPLYEQVSHPETCVSRSMNRYPTQKLVPPALWTGIPPRNLCLPLYEQVSHPETCLPFYEQVSHPETCVSRSMIRYLTHRLVSPVLWTGISPTDLCLQFYEQVSHPATCVSRSMNRYLTHRLVSSALWTGI